jgi:transposase
VVRLEIFQTIAGWHRQGMALREMARRLELDVKTVRRIVAKIDGGAKQPTYRARSSKLDPFAERISELAATGRTARSIYGELSEATSFSASYDLVRRWVTRLRQREPKVYERLEHPPGAEGQIDFATLMRVRYGERTVTAHAFIMSWPHSRWVYEDVVIDQTVPTFLGAIQDGICESGSAPARVTPDNLASAVLRRQARRSPQGRSGIARPCDNRDHARSL